MNKMMENLSPKEIGRRLQEVRKHIGLKQTDVAEQIGVGSLTISRLERGNSVNSSTIFKLLVFYSQYISLNALFEESFPENTEEAFHSNRIEVPVSLLEHLMSFIGKQHKDINNTLNSFQTNFVDRLHKAMGLL